MGEPDFALLDMGVKKPLDVCYIDLCLSGFFPLFILILLFLSLIFVLFCFVKVRTRQSSSFSTAVMVFTLPHRIASLAFFPWCSFENKNSHITITMTH